MYMYASKGFLQHPPEASVRHAHLLPNYEERFLDFFEPTILVTIIDSCKMPENESGVCFLHICNIQSWWHDSG